MTELSIELWTQKRIHTDAWTGNVNTPKNLFLTYQGLTSAILRFSVTFELLQVNAHFKVNGEVVANMPIPLVGTLWEGEADITTRINLGTNSFEFLIEKTPLIGFGDVIVSANVLLTASTIFPPIPTEYIILGGVALVTAILVMKRPRRRKEVVPSQAQPSVQPAQPQFIFMQQPPYQMPQQPMYVREVKQ